LSAQHITSPVQTRRGGRKTAVAVVVAALIGAGGYAATQAIGPDTPAPTRSEEITPPTGF
jgi:hypothetical protein